jgi:hypothetical protein
VWLGAVKGACDAAGVCSAVCSRASGRPSEGVLATIDRSRAVDRHSPSPSLPAAKGNLITNKKKIDRLSCIDSLIVEEDLGK